MTEDRQAQQARLKDLGMQIKSARAANAPQSEIDKLMSELSMVKQALGAGQSEKKQQFTIKTPKVTHSFHHG